ncbi:MAG: hypothetical protein ABF990_02390 [Acetobacter sp.]|uniref:hypothetical protein n=1 Tax=Acetobacter sp. TaxID=440 RepID=UPI0039EC6258
MKRCFAVSLAVLLSCSVAMPVLGAGRRTQPVRHDRAVPTGTKKPTSPEQAAAQSAGQSPGQSAPQPDASSPAAAGAASPDAVVLKGLPAAWAATVLDKPAPPPPAATGTRAASDSPHDKNGRTAKSSPAKTGAQAGAALAAAGAAVQGAAAAASSQARILIPTPAGVGLAAFQSGNRFIIVLDKAEAMDTSALRGDGIFSGLTVTTLPDATLIQVPLPDTRALYLSQQVEGWILGDKPPPGDYGDRRVINPRKADDGILYPMRRPGRVLSITDPASRTRLLVGTSTTDDGGILSLRSGEGYDVWPTTEGVVVAAWSQGIGLRATSDGALLSMDGKAFPDTGAAVYASDVDFKWLGLRDLPLPELAQRFRAATLAAAASEPAQRFARRLDAAKAAFALGSFVEARGILTVALEDDPEEATQPQVRFLLAASELLSGNRQGASLLEGPWPDNQQRAVQLWRGLYLAALGGRDTEASHLLARDFGRLRSYPAAVRDTILPVAAEEIGRYGSQEDVEALGKLPAGAPYELVSAFTQLRSGKRKEAYAAFQKLASAKDPLVAEKAMEQKISLDLANGSMTPAAAADAFELLLADARLAGREAAVRLLQADAYMRAQNWSAALGAIDNALTSSAPTADSVTTPLLFQTLAGIAAQGAKESDKKALLYDTAMLKSHLPILPPGEKKAEILAAYGTMLQGLGLPDDAAQAYSDAIPMLDAPDARARAGEGLANADLARKRPQDAVTALTRTDAPDLPDDIKSARRRAAARVALALGDQAKALFLLQGDTSPQALDTSAGIHEAKSEWAMATADLRIVAETAIPQAGALSESQQALALRLASDASQAGDHSTLDWIAGLVGSRALGGDNDRMFRLLTQPTDASVATAAP